MADGLRANQAAKVLKWLQANGYDSVHAQLVGAIEGAAGVDSRPDVIVREIEGACRAPDMATGCEDGVAGIVATLVLHSAGVLVERGEADPARRVFDHLINVSLKHKVSPILGDLPELRSLLHTAPTTFASKTHTLDLHTTLTALHCTRDFLERHRYLFLLSALCDSFKIRTSIIKNFPARSLYEEEEEPHPKRAKTFDTRLFEGETKSLQVQEMGFACPVDFAEGVLGVACGGKVSVFSETSDGVVVDAWQNGANVSGVRFLKGSRTILAAADERGCTTLRSTSPSDNNTLGTYQLADFAPILSFASHPTAPSLLAVGTTESYTALWSTEHSSSPLRLYDLGRYTKMSDIFITNLTFCQEAGLYGMGSDFVLRSWDPREAVQTSHLDLNSHEQTMYRRRPDVIEVYDMGVSPCGGYVVLAVEKASRAGPFEVQIYDARKREFLQAVSMQGAPVSLEMGENHEVLVACNSFLGEGRDMLTRVQNYDVIGGTSDAGGRVLSVESCSLDASPFYTRSFDDLIMCASIPSC